MLDALIRLADASQRIPGEPSLSTIHRWAVQGLQGGRVKLQTIKVGGKRFTSDDWVHEFVVAPNRNSEEP